MDVGLPLLAMGSNYQINAQFTPFRCKGAYEDIRHVHANVAQIFSNYINENEEKRRLSAEDCHAKWKWMARSVQLQLSSFVFFPVLLIKCRDYRISLRLSDLINVQKLFIALQRMEGEEKNDLFYIFSFSV